MNVRELVDVFDKAAQFWGREQDYGVGKPVGEAKEAHASARAALLAAIDRLERKAATAKAESDAWREHDSPHSGLMAFRAIVEARTATDEAWREPEDKEAKP